MYKQNVVTGGRYRPWKTEHQGADVPVHTVYNRDIAMLLNLLGISCII